MREAVGAGSTGMDDGMASSTSSNSSGLKAEDLDGETIRPGFHQVTFRLEDCTREQAAMCLGLDVLLELPEQPTRYKAAYDAWQWRGYGLRSETIYGAIYHSSLIGRRLEAQMAA